MKCFWSGPLTVVWEPTPRLKSTNVPLVHSKSSVTVSVPPMPCSVPPATSMFDRVVSPATLISPKLSNTVPSPVDEAPVLKVKSPAGCSTAPPAMLNIPEELPPRANCSVPVCTSMVPLFITRMSTIALPVPTVRERVAPDSFTRSPVS